MKRLRVVLVCLIVALLCWNPSHYVYCSEQSLSGPGQSAGNRNPEGHEKEQERELTQLEAEDERAIHTSYDIGLETVETERAALETLTAHNDPPEQNVNNKEAEVEETEPDPELDPAPMAAEHHSDPQGDVDLQTISQDQPQELPESPSSEPVLALVHESSDAPAPAETSRDSEPTDAPSPDSAQTTPPHEAENMPTSQTGSPPQPPSAVRVASEGDDLPVDSFVFAELSDSQCGVIPPELATCENFPFGSPVLSVHEAELEDQQEQISGTKAEVQPTPGPEEPAPHQKQAPQQPESDNALSGLDREANTSQHKQKVGDGTLARETDPSVPSKEDIPTFDEWKKQVMEVEKEKSQSLHTSTSSSTHPVKKVQKNFKNNYASVECGAKILSANSEAKSTSAILKENMDLYMLNPCSTKIWFVIELCEPIQVKQLDIANFELFSSTPKDFLVSLSDRYPTNKWVKLGTFHARDERIVQSFPLDEQLYAKYVKMFIKYIKVELLSHFGSEHFCPLSLIRVFGTSMVEEYEEIADSQYPSERLEFLDEDYDYPPGYQPSEDKASKDLLGSATKAILNMVNNIAANVLGGGPETEGGAENAGNASAEAQNEVEGSKEVASQTIEAAHVSAVLEPAHPMHPEEETNSTQSSTPPLTPPEPVEERQIVTLVQEEEEEEEPQQSTVTLMDEEAEEEEVKEEESRKEADRNQWESQAYCPFSSFSSLSLSCMATLPELLHRWCSARLAKERLRSVRRRNHSQTHASSPAHTSSLAPDPVPVPTLSQEILPVTETALEPEGQEEGKPVYDVHTAHMNDTHTPDFSLLLEPSRTSSIPPQSFSDSHSSLTRPTPTNEDKLLPPVKDAALDPLPTPPLQAVSIPETQQASRATPTPTVNSTPHPMASEASSSVFEVPSAKEQPVQPLPTASRPEDLIPPPTELPVAATDAHPDTDKADSGQTAQSHGEQGDPLTQNGEAHQGDPTVEDDLLNGTGNGHRPATDFYAELQNGGDYNGGAVNGNGGAVHGSSQKESVFMRLNNRIKALEMNMSLSSRYLEELSQRYRKQMEEMQRAFNKTIIKLQNTSRIAEEQDQKQTESIQVLQNQLENVTRVMLNLTATVSQLQREVSDRQSYLVVSLVLCLVLGLLLCRQCCRSSSPNPSTSTAVVPKSNNYPSPKRCFSSYDDMSIKRRVTCPLVRSKSFHLSSTEVGPDDLYIVEPLRFSPEKKKKRCKTKSMDKVETLKADPVAPLTNGTLKCNGFHPALPAPPLPPALPAPPPPPLSLPSSSVEEVLFLPSCPTKESLSESSSCSSSHSEESYTSRLPPPSPVLPPPALCNGHSLPFPLNQPLKRRSMKRRKSKQTELQFPSLPTGGVSSLPSLQTFIKNKDISVGTIGVTAVTGHV